MSERYYITGVQLGMLLALVKETEKQKVADEIIENQYLGTKEELKRFLKEIK